MNAQKLADLITALIKEHTDSNDMTRQALIKVCRDQTPLHMGENYPAIASWLFKDTSLSQNECEECGKPCEGQFCSEECNKAYHDQYKHHNEEAGMIAYLENRYDDYYGGDY